MALATLLVKAKVAAFAGGGAISSTSEEITGSIEAWVEGNSNCYGLC